MEREILFKAWNEDLQMMSEPFGLHSTVITFKYPEESEAIQRTKTLTDEIVLQFTGLPDRNGAKVFEGDILECNEGTKWVSVWFNDDCTFNIIPLDQYKDWYDCLPDSTLEHAFDERYSEYLISNPNVVVYKTVIGNIHDKNTSQ